MALLSDRSRPHRPHRPHRSHRSHRSHRALHRLLPALLVAVSGWTVLAALPAAPAGATTLSIRIVGNHFVNGAGQTVRLLGVNAPSTEYDCLYGAFAQTGLVTSAPAIAGWHADAVRVPLNEDCWLGINPVSGQLSAATYRQKVTSWVNSINAAGLYAILDLHWSAPGTESATSQQPMPDDHSALFWNQVASAFASDPAVVFDAFNEPYIPSASEDSPADWSCWLNGGCQVTSQGGTAYTAVGLQALVDAIRGQAGTAYPPTGADQPILVGGLNSANDLGSWWNAAAAAPEVTDPVSPPQIAASFHNYWHPASTVGVCFTVSCWNATVAPIAAQVPVVTGEFDQGYDCAHPPTTPALVSFDTTYMNWADAHGVSYLAWGWWVLGNTGQTCSTISGAGNDNYDLISDFDGTAAAPDGGNLELHLDTLAGIPPLAVTTTSLPGADLDVRYGATLAATGGNGPFTWAKTAGSLPSGLSLNKTTGVIGGTPKATGTFSVTVQVSQPATASQPAETASTVLSLSVVAPVPAITKITPATGTTAGGTKVTVTGSGLYGTTAVAFGPDPAASYTVNGTGTSLTAVTPAEPAGPVTVVVTAPGGSVSGSFTFVTPAITKISPTAGPVAGNTKVVITGTGFAGATAVAFGSDAAASYTVNAAGTSITAFTPAESAGSVPVTVASLAGPLTAPQRFAFS